MNNLKTLVTKDSLVSQAIKCTTCEETKEISFFVKNPRCKFGVEKTCRACKQIHQNEYHKRKKQTTGKWAYDAYYEKHLQYCNNWRKRNKPAINALASTRRAATPSWVDLKSLKEFYKACPIGYEVDHIIPINNPIVCGLNTLNNLQYLPRTANRQKGNKFYADEQRDAGDGDAGRSSFTGY